ncbi:MAG: phytoene desaturase [Gemmatimonadales bacterium]|nr:phytoene desaturase [Gemmatimonadales bacterium]
MTVGTSGLLRRFAPRNDEAADDEAGNDEAGNREPGNREAGNREAANDDSAKRHVLIVGAGLGGLSAAVRLRARGYEVTVLERHAHPGGRCGYWESDGFRFDTGPTLLLMVDYLRALFTDAGRNLDDYLDLVQLDPNYRVYYADGSTLDVTSRLNAMLEGIERIEPGVTPRFLRFLSDSAKLYSTGLAFVDRNVHRARDFFKFGDASVLAQSGALGRLRRLVSRYFRDDRLRNAFSFQSLYLGLSPYKSMAIYSLLPFTEVAGGLWFPMGGMHAMPRAIAKLAAEMGVRFEYDTNVASLERDGTRIAGVMLDDGTRRDADIVLMNADLPYAYETLLGERLPRADKLAYSCSAFLMYLGVDRTYPGLPHHNLVVPEDLERCCGEIFDEMRVPADPAYYVCNPNKTDPSLAPAGCENIYVLVPVPSQDPARPIDWSTEGPRLEAAMLERLERFGLTDLRRHIVTKRIFTPDNFASVFSATRSEAFGLAHGLDQVGYFRPHNRHARYENLFFVGQSTHPGCGIPMSMISSRCVTERIAEEQAVPR